MPYEDEYKMWLEKMLIEMNPDWICDGMHDAEFTHDWCYKYCGKDDLYITPKCLHMYYHHIVMADRKTENNSEKPNNCECEPRKEQNFCGKCRYLYRDFKYGLSCYRLMDNEPCKYEERKDEPTISKMEQVDKPKTQTETQNSNLTFEKQTDCPWK